MVRLSEVVRELERLAPLEAAESWDNVGLLLGDPDAPVRRLMTCLTVDQAVVDEAVRRDADLIVTHHPLPFRPVLRLTTGTRPGRYIWQLARAGVAVYSPHTAYDSADRGINRQLAGILGLAEIGPLRAADEPGTVAAGVLGICPDTPPLGRLADQLATALDLEGLRLAGDAARPVRRVAIACGSGQSLLPNAMAQEADLFITGEATFHAILEGLAGGLCLLLTGHYASERIGVETLAKTLEEILAGVEVWASEAERPPWKWRPAPNAPQGRGQPASPA